MKRSGYLLASVLGALAMLVLLAASPADREGAVGRYQLFQGEFYHYVSESPEALPTERDVQIGVFLLDTASGETWEYFQSNQLPSRWVPTPAPTVGQKEPLSGEPES